MGSTVVDAIKSELGKEIVLSRDQLQDRYSHIWEMDRPLEAKAVVLPRTTDEVSRICRICHEMKQPIVVHGGLTGLVGSTRSAPDDLVISLEKMNTIEEIDERGRTITTQSGVVLETALRAAESKGLFLPLNFGARGSAQIGGCIATNAGGLRVVRYGMTRNMVLGLEVVLPDGTVLSSMKKLLKDNSGYGLYQLFIGSEGTLGIITKAVLRLQELPQSRNSAFVSFDQFEKVIDFLKFADSNLNGQLSGFEILWGDTYKDLTTSPSLHQPPLPHGHPFYVLLETLGGNITHDRELLETMLEKATKTGLVNDAVMAYSSKDLEEFWNVREDVGLLNKLSPFQQQFDISLPITKMADYVEETRKSLLAVPGVVHLNTFGHLADGNVHFVVGKSSEDQELKTKINEIVYTPLSALQGSVSAEHGIGIDKKPWLPYCRSSDELELMKKIKATIDPHKILNRGRIID